MAPDLAETGATPAGQDPEALETGAFDLNGRNG